MRFRPEQHLRRAADFQRVRVEGRRFDCGAFTLWHAPRPTSESRTFFPPDGTEASAIATSTPSAVKSASTTQEPGPARAGFVASRSAVGGAVQRNRAKRRLREAFRRQQLLAPAGRDLILVARATAGRLPFAELERRLAEACRKISAPVSPPSA
jgi:ribonuclease P protein component